MEEQKAKGKGLIGVLALVALMLAVAYYGGDVTRIASAVQVPVTRISTGGVELVAAPPAGAEAEVDVALPSQDGFEAYRETIQKTRETSAALLDEVIADVSAGTDTVQGALKQKAELASAIEMEGAAEALLRARGFQDAICSVQKGGVSVVVRGMELTQQQAAQILDIAMTATGEPASRIRIIPAE